MNTVTILLGSNIGNSRLLLQEAEQLLTEQLGSIQSTSSLIESEPWGFDSTQWFLNRILVINTELQAKGILHECQKIEQMLGRKRTDTIGYESRTIDIDILFFNNDIIHQTDLVVPHPKLHLRRFTLLPLHEIMPGYIHPVLNKSIDTLLNECSDTGICRKIE
jgi:2-amino-4-hydroxy-6-hydroxymethyldihydropteridine diphosphokinase